MLVTMKNFYQKHLEKIKFLIVGGWNTLFGFVVFAGLFLAFKHVLHYIIILIVTYMISITNAYISYKLLVFKTKGNYFKEYMRFYQVYGVSFVINLLLLPFFVEFLKISAIISQGLLVFFIAAVSYVGHKYYSFNV